MSNIATDLKTAKKGDGVHMYTFTGMYLGIFEITAADKKSVSIVQKNGRTTKFDRETGKQLEAKTPRCASKITVEKIEKVAPVKKAAKKAAPAVAAAPAKKAKKAKPVVESDDEYEEA